MDALLRTLYCFFFRLHLRCLASQNKFIVRSQCQVVCAHAVALINLCRTSIESHTTPDQGMHKRSQPSINQFVKKQRGPTPNWLDHLEEKGWVVIPNVISKERCGYYQERMFDMLESFEGSGFSRDNPITWKKTSPPGLHGLIQHQGVGQTALAWEARTEPAVLKVFSELWNCLPEDLLVSFDAMNFSPPTKPTPEPRKQWKHFDQGKKMPGQRVCVQGCLQVSQCNGGTSFLSGSHNKHAEFVKQPGVNEDGSNWVKLRKEDYAYFSDCENVAPHIEMGSLILWYSCTAHDAKLPTDSYRMAIYVCYLPRSRATKAQLEKKKKKVFRERRMTTHWPFGDRMFTKVFRWASPEQRAIFTDRAPVRDDQMSPLAWRLAGF